MITQGGEIVEIFTTFRPTIKGPPVYFAGKEDAHAFVRRFFFESSNRSQLRSILAEVQGALRVDRLTDDQVMDALAEAFASGRIWAVRVHLSGSYTPVVVKEYMTPLEVSRAEPPPPPPPSPARTAPPPTRTTAPAFSPAAGVAQAAALQQAAATGAPFCEH